MTATLPAGPATGRFLKTSEMIGLSSSCGCIPHELAIARCRLCATITATSARNCTSHHSSVYVCQAAARTLEPSDSAVLRAVDCKQVNLWLPKPSVPRGVLRFHRLHKSKQRGNPLSLALNKVMYHAAHAIPTFLELLKAPASRSVVERWNSLLHGICSDMYPHCENTSGHGNANANDKFKDVHKHDDNNKCGSTHERTCARVRSCLFLQLHVYVCEPISIQVQREHKHEYKYGKLYTFKV